MATRPAVVEYGTRTLTDRTGKTNFIRQGEFAVLLLMAMKVPPPPGGWNGEKAVCFLSASPDCGDVPGTHPGKIPPLLAARNGVGETGPGEADSAGESGAIPPFGLQPEGGWKAGELLTEGVLVELLGQIGISMITEEPETPVPWELAARVLEKFGYYLDPPESDPAEPPSEPLAIFLPGGHPGPQVMSPSVP